MIRTALRTLLAVTVLSLVCQIGLSQVSTGTPPFGSFGGGPFDTVNLGNLNVHFAVPIIHKAGRGLPFNYDLVYESSVWSPVNASGSPTWTPSGNFGWLPNMFGSVGYLSSTTSYSYCYDAMGHMTGQVTTVSNWVYYDPWGVAHRFSSSIVVYAGSCTGTSNTYINENASDQSGFALHVDTGGTYMTARDGRVFVPPQNPGSGGVATTITDANGNKISTDSSGHFTDTIGSTVLTVSGSSPVNFAYTAPGGSATVSMSYVTYSVKTNFGCSGVSEYGPTNVALADRITLPDGTYYAFTYEPTPGFSGKYTGRIKQVTLPTGGTITYTYSGGNNGIVCSDGTAAGLTRTLNPGGAWTYTRTQVSGNHWQTKVTTPPDPQNSGSASNDTVIDFMKDSATGSGIANTYNFFETQRQSYQGTSTSGTLLRTTITCWNNNTSNCTTTAVAAPITQTSTTLQYPSGLQSKTAVAYGSYGPTDVTQYAYSSGAPTTVLRHTQTSYASFGNFSSPSSVTVDDGNGHTLFQTNYTYDEYSSYPLQATSGTPQHVSVAGSRGNLTTIARKVIGTTYLSQHFAYYDTGNVYRSYDVNGATTTYNYSNATSTCGNSFPTSVTFPISGLSTSTSYNCAGAVGTGANDLNGQPTSVSYTDPYFWRPVSTTDPTSAVTNFYYRTSNQGKVESYITFNSGNSIAEQMTSVDGFGRPIVSQQQTAPGVSTFNGTEVDYDVFGRPTRSTMPYPTSTYGGQNSTAPATTTTYDTLNRVKQTTDGGGGYVIYTYNQNDVKQAIGPAPSGESLKQKQSEYDALGRLTSVCELTSLTGYVNCGQTNAYNGYLTTYTYGVNGSGYPTMTVTQGPSGSQQTRTYTYDLLGRLISEQNPENGTTSYSFDSGANCSGSYPGDLVQKTDARNNITCNKYDSLHRLLTVTYASGPDIANTPMKYFVWDASYSNPSTVNTKGRLGSAGTCLNPTCAGNWYTLEDFSYSARGELTDVYELTPHSGSTYRVTAAYWANGATSSLSSNISGLPTQTYGVDGMGRTSLVTASAGQNPVTGTTYDLSTFTSSVTFGSGDSDTFYLDPNTGRQTKYVFNVNGVTNTGQTNWNQNGSLGSLQITDNISGTSDTQTCNYTHDDLSRIASVNCANGATAKWNQSFTYDRFGNITKNSSGPGISFTPGYQASSNWITSLPGITPTTDANGRMTYDGTHNYGWDAESNMISVDSTTMTYDALGRMVEKNVSGTYTQIVYGPQGRFATMNGLTLVNAFIPVPGAQAVYTNASVGTSNKIAYYRHADHLGSSRLATTPTRTLYSSTAYAPTGEPYAQAGTTDLSFTGQEQDTVSGMHDFLFRKFVPVQGRWLSPDPAGLAVADPMNPQSWNRYAYVVNNPMALIDPFGTDSCQLGSAGGEWGFCFGPGQPSGTGPILGPLPGTSPLGCDIGYDGLDCPDPLPSCASVGCNNAPVNRSGVGGGTGTGGGQTGKPLSPQQCEALQAVLQIEKDHGTYFAAVEGNITFNTNGGFLRPFNSDSTAGYSPVNSAVGPMNLDWFSTLRAISIYPGQGLSNYAVGKTIWIGMRHLAPGILPPVTNNIPFSVADERNAAIQAAKLSKFSDLFPPDWMQQNCK